MLSDEFMERVMTMDSEKDNAEMINREFYGMMAVASFEEEFEASEKGGDDK